MKQRLTVKPKPGIVLTALLFGLLLCGCDRSHQPPPFPAPEVAVVKVALQQVELTTELPGRTSAFRIAEIRPQVSGIIQKRLFTEGADVKAGDTLYQIDPAPFQAALDNAKAALGRAEAGLPAIRLRTIRYNELLSDKAVSQQECDDAAAALRQAEADIEYWKAAVQTSEINLGYSRIIAPISGRIGISGVTDGALAAAYQPVALTTIQQLNPIYVDVTQSTTELQRLKRRLNDGRLNQNGENHNEAKIILEDGMPYASEGKLQFRDVTVDPSTGTVILRIIVPNPDGTLLPGMFVRAIVKEGINDKAILIPQQAVTRDPKGNPLALIAEAEGKIGQRMLTLDRAIGDKWLVSSGLQPGDQVIVEGMQRLRPGVSVKVVPFEAGSDKKGSPEMPPGSPQSK
jgi:membrane fusion protein (multidrug efflux system)